MKKSLCKMVLFIVLLTAGFIAFTMRGVQNFSPEMIRGFILSFGVLAPLIYIFLYTVRPLVFFPASLLSLSGGLAFGPWWGTTYDLIGASLGAYMAFGLARNMGRETIQRWLGNRLHLLELKTEEYGFRSILILRLIPLIPFDAISYGAGLSKVRFRDFAFGTLLGMIPGAFAYNFLGHSLNHMFSTTFYTAVGIVVLLALLPAIYKWIKSRS